MTTYTVFNPAHTSGAQSGLTASEAAIELLTYDGYEYEVRRGDPRHDVDGEAQWELWVSDGSRNSQRGARHMASTTILAYGKTEEDAWPAIAQKVLDAGVWGREVMTDSEYAAMLAEMDNG